MFFYLLGFSKRESQLIFIFSSIKQKLSLGSSSHNSFLRCLGLSSSILLIKSAFSKQPSHVSSQSFRIFFKSLTFSFFKSTLFKSICFSEKMRKNRENTFRRSVKSDFTKNRINTHRIEVRKLVCLSSLAFHKPCQ